MFKVFGIIILLSIVVKLAEKSAVFYLRYLTVKSKFYFEQENQRIWLARYEKTIPEWFAMTDR